MARKTKITFTAFAIVDCVEYNEGDNAELHYREAEELIRNGRAKPQKEKGKSNGKTSDENQITE